MVTTMFILQVIMLNSNFLLRFDVCVCVCGHSHNLNVAAIKLLCEISMALM